MEAPDFDELAFFGAIADSKVRALLIGRRAMVILGLPVNTADYDFWLHPEDIESFNRAVLPFGLSPTHPPDLARSRGHYALENDEHVDVWIAREGRTVDGEVLTFDALWAHRQTIPLTPTLSIAIPTIDGLIATKRLSRRPKDLDDIRLLEILRAEEATP